MPIYDYRCGDCGRVFEVLVRGSSLEGTRCPTCSGHRLEKLPSAAQLVRSHPSGGATCCGREERCETPPCSSGGGGCCRG